MKDNYNSHVKSFIYTCNQCDKEVKEWRKMLNHLLRTNHNGFTKYTKEIYKNILENENKNE